MKDTPLIPGAGRQTRLRFLAAGALASALAASSCCVLPLVLAVLGAGGAWTGALTRLAPYQPVFLALAAVSITWGFWLAYGGREPACEGADCRRLKRSGAAKLALWTSAAVFVAAATVNWWANLLA